MIYAGPVELAAVGVSTSVFNLVSKIFNIPLLNITTSFVAEEQALISKKEDSSQTDENSKFYEKATTFLILFLSFSWTWLLVGFLAQIHLLRTLVSHGCCLDFTGKYQSKKLVPSVSTSLALAATLGIAETVVLSLGSGIIMNIMGIHGVCQP